MNETIDSLASAVQLDFAARVKESFANNTGNFQALYLPGQYDGQCEPDVRLWYLKPLYVCAPDQQFPHVWSKIKCPHCQAAFRKSGWLESIAYNRGVIFMGSYKKKRLHTSAVTDTT